MGSEPVVCANKLVRIAGFQQELLDAADDDELYGGASLRLRALPER